MRGLMRSAVSTSGGDTQGGSTLTMQYVKQMRYYQAGKDVKAQQAAIDQNLNRKIEDAKCAIFIENTEHESKDKILENYLNIAFFGENSYGIQTAAQTYFNKDVKKLTLPESAMLVGLLRAPTQYDPFKFPVAAKKRRNEVLQNLVAVGQLSQRDANKFKAQPVSLATTEAPVVKEGCANANSSIKNVGFFCDYAVHWLETVGKISDTKLTTGGLKIVTTLDANLQNSMQTNVSAAIPASSPMTAVLPAVDPRTGNVLAMATSKRYGTNSSTEGPQPHVAADLHRVLGTGCVDLQALPVAHRPVDRSSDGLAAADAADQRRVQAKKLPDRRRREERRRPGVLQHQRRDCARPPSSRRTRTSSAWSTSCWGATWNRSRTWPARLGMKSLLQPSGDGRLTVKDTILQYQRPGELVLGDVGTSPLELAGAYAAVANNGKFNAPAPIQSITDENGKPIEVKRSPGVQVVAPQVAMQAVDILAGDTKCPWHVGDSVPELVQPGPQRGGRQDRNQRRGRPTDAAGHQQERLAVVRRHDTEPRCDERDRELRPSERGRIGPARSGQPGHRGLWRLCLRRVAQGAGADAVRPRVGRGRHLRLHPAYRSPRSSAWTSLPRRRRSRPRGSGWFGSTRPLPSRACAPTRMCRSGRSATRARRSPSRARRSPCA